MTDPDRSGEKSQAQIVKKVVESLDIRLGNLWCDAGTHCANGGR